MSVLDNLGKLPGQLGDVIRGQIDHLDDTGKDLISTMATVLNTLLENQEKNIEAILNRTYDRVIKTKAHVDVSLTEDGNPPHGT